MIKKQPVENHRGNHAMPTCTGITCTMYCHIKGSHRKHTSLYVYMYTYYSLLILKMILIFTGMVIYIAYHSCNTTILHQVENITIDKNRPIYKSTAVIVDRIA